MCMRTVWRAACALLIAASAAQADVKLHGLFTDNMVLQQGKTVPIWGTADEGERVTVAFLGQVKSATAKGGKWMVKLDPLNAGGPYTLTVTGKNKITLKNVLVGEVWICSGQSNMNYRVGGVVNAKEEIARSENPMIRSYTVPRRVAEQPQSDVSAQWELCNPKTVGHFTAVGYFFARDLQKALKVPVGIIHTSWGGTPAEAWTRREVLEANSKLKPILERWKKILAAYPAALEKYKKRREQWMKKRQAALRAGEPFLQRSPRPPHGPKDPHRPAVLYNGMIAPLIPYAIAGAIWYQGESNAGRAYEYRTLFPAMIQCWRRDWGQGDFPFFWAQLAAFKQVWTEPKSAPWPELREAQALALKLPNTGMAVLTDLGNPSDIHPRRKQQVGARLALAARAIAYGEKIVYSGPMFDKMTVKGSKAELTFKHAGGGLVVKGDGTNPPPVSGYIHRAERMLVLKNRFQRQLASAKARAAKKPEDKGLQARVKRLTRLVERMQKQYETALARARKQAEAEAQRFRDALAARDAADGKSKLKGFAVCGPDRKFVWAHAEIAAPDKVVVWSAKVAQPVAVRYAWEDYPICNLYNKEGLPAVPFRTDDFPMVTAPKN